MAKSGPFLRWIDLALRWVLGGVFIWAGAVKLFDVRAFARVISQYNLLPEDLLAEAAIGLPVLEVLAGLGLILGARGSLTVITALLVMFALALWFGILQGLSVDCGCFSAAEQAEHDGLREAFIRDQVMLGAALWLHWRARRRPGGAISDTKPQASSL